MAALSFFALLVGGIGLLHRSFCDAAARQHLAQRSSPRLELARHLAAAKERWIPTTGSVRFDGEWRVVANQMAVLGLGQVVLQHSLHEAALMPAIDRAIDQLVAPSARRFGTSAWGVDGLSDAGLASAGGHAYLGYIGLALSMARLLRCRSRHARLHDALIAAFVRRLEASKTALIETYPGETYPADVGSVVGSIGLYLRAGRRCRRRGAPLTALQPDIEARYRALLGRFRKQLLARYLEPRSGLLYQRVTAHGKPVSAPRASGTAIACYFLSFADRELAKTLYAGLQRQLRSVAGYGGIREYPAGHAGRGDVDSGPLAFGISVSATGFALASARIFNDRETFLRLYRTACLFGAPVRARGQRCFAVGGYLGNAIMLAMLTARPVGN
jgi:hypothetical protein